MAEKEFNRTLGIENICGGAVPEVFERELREVLENIADRNTPADAKRTIVLEFQLAPFPDRSGASVAFHCKGKLAAISPVAGSVFFAKRGAVIEAYAHDPRQTQLFGTTDSIRENKQ